MTTAAWGLLFVLIGLPLCAWLGAVLGKRFKARQTCDCGGFKLPRAASCFDCTTR